MVVHTEDRKKPKKADFVHDGIRYWICSADYYLYWDDEYSQEITYNVKLFDSDEEFDEEQLWDDVEYLKKAHKAGLRVLPFDHSAYDGYLY